MSREMTAEAAAALAADDLLPALFFEGEFANGTVRLWTGYENIDWNGEVWAGAGTLIGIGDVVESQEVQAEGMSVSLSGVPVELISAAIDEARQNLPGRVWLAFLDSAGAIVPDPIELFGGRLDVPEIQDGEDSAKITISYEGLLVDLNRPREILYTHEAQQTLYPGDRGLEYMAAIQGIDIVWGRPS